MSNLIIIRHAKSDWSGNVNDLQRGLNKRGYNSCIVISEELKKRIDKPDLFLISPALRAQLTYENIFLNWDNKDNLLSIEEDLYHASIDQIKKKLTSKVLGFSTVVVIGHNPILNLLMYSFLPKGLFPAGCASATFISSEIVFPFFILIITFPPKHFLLGSLS